MNAADYLDAFDALPRRWRQRAGRTVLIVLAVVTMVLPGVRLAERVSRWWREAYTERVRDRLGDITVLPTPSLDTDAGPSPAALR